MQDICRSLEHLHPPVITVTVYHHHHQFNTHECSMDLYSTDSKMRDKTHKMIQKVILQTKLI